MSKRILITGASGQIGSELTLALRAQGDNKVFAAGHSASLCKEITDSGPIIMLDVCDYDAVERAIDLCSIDTIYHMAGMLSAKAEQNPALAWKINVDGLQNILNAAVKHSCSVFFPSSIGAFGPQAPADNTPQVTVQRPTSIYGVTKVCGEMLCDYYHKRYGLDTRGIRLPGLISHATLPGGGTTDYAVEIFFEAIKTGKYQCYLKKGTYLDMMYMPDALKGIMQLMAADPPRLVHRNAYNITAMSFAPEDLQAAIIKHLPHFKMTSMVDPARQGIADSWPNKLDDSAAREEWGWNPKYDLAAMVKDMLTNLKPASQKKHTSTPC